MRKNNSNTAIPFPYIEHKHQIDAEFILPKNNRQDAEFIGLCKVCGGKYYLSTFYALFNSYDIKRMGGSVTFLISYISENIMLEYISVYINYKNNRTLIRSVGI